MKKIIIALTPGWFIRWYRNARVAKNKNKSAKEVFTEIYSNNYWSSEESLSGKGSESIQTNALIKHLDKLLADLNITSMLDVPCGDFNWMQKVNLQKVDYTGADIVEELIKKNRVLYEKMANVKFEPLNIINGSLPKTDIVFVRDCLVHLSYDDIKSAIKNIKLSGSKYLLTTTFIKHHSNFNIITGNWRPLNLQQPPFNFPAPILIINEDCTEDDGEYNDKSMALWEINKL